MNFWALIPLASCVAYLILFSFAIWQVKKRANKVFALFVFLSLMWSFSAFMLSHKPSASTQYLVFWNDMVIAGVVASIVSYYHFVRAFIGKSDGFVVYAGYVFVLAIIALSLGGHVVKDANIVNGYVHHDLGPWMVMMIATLIPILTLTLRILAKQYKASRDPIERNRLTYLMLGWGIVAVYSPVNANVPQLAGLPTDHLGTLLNAIIIGVAISKYHLLDIRLVAQKTLVYSILFASFISFYVGVMLLVNIYVPHHAFTVVIVSSMVSSLLFSILLRPMRDITENMVDRIFHRDVYKHREMLLAFSDVMAHVLDLKEVSEQLLSMLGKALRLTHADLLLMDAGTDEFITAFSYPIHKAQAGDKLRLSRDNAVVTWLYTHKNHLIVENIGREPSMNILTPRDRDEIVDTRFALLLPIFSRDRLIGILGLGHKQVGRCYRAEDIHFAMTMAKQASFIIDNAQLYAQAKDRANVDELTNLFNHRHFQERIDQEISRSTRFGEVFSLLSIDLDLFKCCNDVYGHKHGDDVLKAIGRMIKGSIRDMDTAFRYGGDEFSVILPQTSADSAAAVAERIRKAIESLDEPTGVTITCSVGIASWPADGVMRDELIKASDSVLYYAKQTGRNRVCTMSSMSSAEASDLFGSGAKRAVLNTIYALAATVDAKDHYTFGHSRKVSNYSADVAAALGYTKERIAIVRAAGLLHDIGKIGVSDKILEKPGKLDDEEWKPILAHPTMGVSIIKHVESLKDCVAAVLYHHEHYDGSGYPSGLKGDNIPLDARILAVADSYDAMTSPRPYRNQITKGEALEELIRCAGTHFDPKVVREFVRYMRETSSEPSPVVVPLLKEAQSGEPLTR